MIKITLLFACLILPNFSNVRAWMDGHERSNATNSTPRETEPFEIPERSYIYIQKLPPIEGDVLHGRLKRVTESITPLGNSGHGFAKVVLNTGEHFSAFLVPFNEDYDWHNDGTQEYRSFITRTNKFGFVALLQPPDSRRPLNGLSRVYYIGADYKIIAQGPLQHSRTGFW